MPQSRALDAALRLRASLDAVAGALGTPNEALLLGAEAGLAAALADMGGVRNVDPADRTAVAEELKQARAALARCRILGAMVTDVARVTLTSQGRDETYNRAGAAPSRLSLRGTSVKAQL